MSIVAIVGRPNVGKSTLFNRLIGRREALVSDMPGVTRDRIYSRVEWGGVPFTVVDTGGLSFAEGDAVEAQVHNMSLAASEEAEVVICLFDGQEGITPLDLDVVETLRKSGKRAVYVVNKVDTASHEARACDFSSLGVDVISVSAEHGRNIDELLDEIVSLLPEDDGRPRRVAPTQEDVEAGLPAGLPDKPVGQSEGIRVALVGRPNVGKSTIINRLVAEERVVVHEIPGTTRDAIDVTVDFGKKRYVFVDTAGIKKRAKTSEKLDKFSTLKSLRAIEDATIALVVVDVAEGITRQDLTLIAHSFGRFKGTSILVNKWDLVEAKPAEFIRHARRGLGELRNLPILCISGRTGFNCERIFAEVDSINSVMGRRIPTSKLNKFFAKITGENPPPTMRHKEVRLKYITQVDVKPPSFVIFANMKGGVGNSYTRFLVNNLRRLIGDPMIPIRLKFKAK